MTEYVQVTTTTDAEDDARTLATGLVEARLAACAQVIGPITSVYPWEGAVETATEWQVVAKTTRACFDALAAWVAEHHGYDLPELVATPIIDGGADYLRWIAQETEARGGQ